MPDSHAAGLRIDAEMPGVRAGLPVLSNTRWNRDFPWLVQGITTAPTDFRLWGRRLSAAPRASDPGAGPRTPPEDALGPWESLLGVPGVREIVHGRQLHGISVRHHVAGAPGIRLAPPLDGHITRAPGVLLAVTVADCVPVFLLAPDLPAVALLHAGWRGSASGILEAGISAFRDRFGVDAASLHLFLGPCISGRRYEVGPEVHEALGLPVPEAPTPLDLAAVLAERATKAGVLPSRISRSERCTLEDPLLHSHRGGNHARQVAFLAIRDPEAS